MTEERDEDINRLRSLHAHELELVREQINHDHKQEMTNLTPEHESQIDDLNVCIIWELKVRAV